MCLFWTGNAILGSAKRWAINFRTLQMNIIEQKLFPQQTQITSQKMGQLDEKTAKNR